MVGIAAGAEVLITARRAVFVMLDRPGSLGGHVCGSKRSFCVSCPPTALAPVCCHGPSRSATSRRSLRSSLTDEAAGHRGTRVPSKCPDEHSLREVIVSWSAADIPDQHGRTAVVTGANGGLGLETARQLAAK